MASLAYPFEVRDTANTTTDNRKTGLTVTIAGGHTLASSPANVANSTVTIAEIGSGMYCAFYDAEANGDASFPIDCGSSLTNPNDRYQNLVLTRDSGRIISGFNAAGQVALQPAESLIHRTGTAQGGTSTTITLDSGAASSANSYMGHVIAIIAGTGSPATRQIIAGYDGTTKIAPINRAWTTTPDSTSVFSIYRLIGPVLDSANAVTPVGGSATPANIATAVWQTTTAGDLSVADSPGAIVYSMRHMAVDGAVLSATSATSFSVSVPTGYSDATLSSGVTLEFTGGANILYRLAVASATRSGTSTTVALTFASPGFPVAPSVGDTYKIF